MDEHIESYRVNTSPVNRFRSCFTATNINTVLAICFTVIYSIWFILLFLQDKISIAEVVSCFQLIFQSLGFLLIRSNVTQLPDHIVFNVVQICISLGLVWGIRSKSIILLEIWLMYTIGLGFLNAYFQLNVFLSYELFKGPASALVKFLSTQLISFYVFYTLYGWRIYSLRRKLILTGSGNGYSNGYFKAGLTLACVGNLFILSYLFLRLTPKYTEESILYMGNMVSSFIFIGLLLTTIMVFANFKDWVTLMKIWMFYQLFASLFFFTREITRIVQFHAYQPEHHGLLSLNLRDFFAVDLPLLFTLLIVYKRILGIKEAEQALVNSVIFDGLYVSAC